jgi:ribosomal protein S3AE
MERIRKAIDQMDHNEIKEVREAYLTGHMENLINEKLQQKLQEDPNKVCPVCNSPIEDSNMTLVFGPSDFRKKASFCALDCLEFFLGKIKNNGGK